jgi:hypothetical protein
MATSIIDGPWHVSGAMQPLAATDFGSGGVPDPNNDASPSLFYQGVGIPDPRLVYLKDKVTGYTGVVQAFQSMPTLQSVNQIPAALGAALIAAAQNVVINVPMTLAVAAVGITRNVPIRPFSAVSNGGTPVTAAIALDFGFAFGNCAAGNPTITVARSSDFVVGMPLVIGGVGNSGGTIPLLTQVASLASATTITVTPTAVPLATNATAPIGTGDLWGPNPNGFPAPLAASPFIAGGPGLFLDPRQTIARVVSISSGAGAAGGDFTVAGWDIYGQPMTETITVGAGVATAYGQKAFKYIASVTPLATNAFNYSVGTGDAFGFHFRSDTWEDTLVSWVAATQVATQGWTAGDQTSPATATTNDVRGTIQTGAAGSGTGIGATASNGTVSGLLMSGRRLMMAQRIPVQSMLRATPSAPQTLFGVSQV